MTEALLNVEGNFYPNVDYAACFERGVHVLGCGPVYADAVAEFALGLGLDLARGITREDRAFRAGGFGVLVVTDGRTGVLRHWCGRGQSCRRQEHSYGAKGA